MRSYIDDNDKKNEIRMLFKHPLYNGKFIVVVEGKTDVRLFRGLLDHEDLRIETIDGKKELISVMKDLVKEFPERLLGICDSDFDHLTGDVDEKIGYSVYVTDEHDAEVMMLNSPSLDSFINEYSSFENLELIQADLLNKALEASYCIGVLRWINTDQALNINFKGLNFNSFVDVNRLEISVDVSGLVDQLIQRSGSLDGRVTKGYLIGQISEYEQKRMCKMQVCCGHDVTNIIAMIHRQKWASLDTNMDHKKVESCLRIGYQKTYFTSTQLFQHIRESLGNFGIELEMG